ncbi:hypothetical protein ACIRFH_19120 [Streptomyces sp. NPDC093586]|uniref:hypothetical protein n=1 Tax=Streptomyces sp. NPDC093586 TaxID=3366042 RepID=UPI00381EB0A3
MARAAEGRRSGPCPGRPARRAAPRQGCRSGRAGAPADTVEGDEAALTEDTGRGRGIDIAAGREEGGSLPHGRGRVGAGGSAEGARGTARPAAERAELLGRVRRFEEAARRRVADLRTKPARAEEFAVTLRERLEA